MVYYQKLSHYFEYPTRNDETAYPESNKYHMVDKLTIEPDHRVIMEVD